VADLPYVTSHTIHGPRDRATVRRIGEGDRGSKFTFGKALRKQHPEALHVPSRRLRRRNLDVTIKISLAGLVSADCYRRFELLLIDGSHQFLAM